MNPTARSSSRSSSRPSLRGLTLGALALVSIPLGLTVACNQVRYTESFSPKGDIDHVVLRTDAGVIELVAAKDLRVQRAIRGPEAALSLSHHVEDGTLYLDAHCAALLPCAVDTRVELPGNVPVEVDLGDGEIWATGLSDLTLELDSGTADVDLSGSLQARIGSGNLHARLGSDSQARVGVGNGDIDIEVPAGAWTVDAETAHLQLLGLESVQGATGQLDLVAPAGSVTVHATAGLASR
ncbi:MAG: DUF4097 domain-containing protein [Oligoflexia bacterium]|nr:DUF4097 domain-containing protein [Oligoflexia bacterium]